MNQSFNIANSQNHAYIIHIFIQNHNHTNKYAPNHISQLKSPKFKYPIWEPVKLNSK